MTKAEEFLTERKLNIMSNWANLDISEIPQLLTDFHLAMIDELSEGKIINQSYESSNAFNVFFCEGAKWAKQYYKDKVK